MVTDTLAETAPERSTGIATYLLKLLAGPATFAIVLALPIALSYEGRVVLGARGAGRPEHKRLDRA